MKINYLEFEIDIGGNSEKIKQTNYLHAYYLIARCTQISDAFQTKTKWDLNVNVLANYSVCLCVVCVGGGVPLLLQHESGQKQFCR